MPYMEYLGNCDTGCERACALVSTRVSTNPHDDSHWTSRLQDAIVQKRIKTRVAVISSVTRWIIVPSLEGSGHRTGPDGLWGVGFFGGSNVHWFEEKHVVK